MIKTIRTSAYRHLATAAIACLAVAAASLLSGCAYDDNGPTQDPVLQQHMYTPGMERPPTGGHN